ncbi:FAD-binding oxidoreductase [Synechocystis sp. LKSZ1]|uniref:FAD-binding oxidoreductase n=1 Tax=Synechocystis sp. LKSZ1 TaxID=3144951 RepID=UPI00336BFD0C
MSPAPTIQLPTFSDASSVLQPWEGLAPTERESLQAGLAAGVIPYHCLAPVSVEDAAQVIGQATAQGLALLPCGNGTKLQWGGPVRSADWVLSSRQLNRIVEYAAADLTVTAEAGVRLADLQAFLAPQGQFLPLDPSYDDRATLGGIMATGDAGSWRQRYGGVRDLVLGFSFLRWDGKLAKAGGKVVKNVAGYDLMKLFVGSYGTLGFITQMSLRLYPRPPVSQTLLLTATEQGALARLAQALLTSGLTPTAADLLSPQLMQALGLGIHLGLLVRFQNIPEGVAEQSDRLQHLAQALDQAPQIWQGESEQDLWQRLKRTMTVAPRATSVTCKIGVMPSQAVNFLQQLPGWGQIHLGTGLGRLTFDQGIDPAALQRQRILCQNYRGFLSILESPASYKTQLDPWGYDGNALDLMGRLKQQFDPQQCFSPGRFVAGI